VRHFHHSLELFLVIATVMMTVQKHVFQRLLGDVHAGKEEEDRLDKVEQGFDAMSTARWKGEMVSSMLYRKACIIPDPPKRPP
jgi:hypothetical protein